MCKVTYELNDTDSAKKNCKHALNLIETDKEPGKELKSKILSNSK